MSWVIEDNHGCADLPPTFIPETVESAKQVPEIKQWCEENFGSQYQAGRWYLYSNMFSFFKEDDAFLFRMRWC
jgi:hypothetical protein